MSQYEKLLEELETMAKAMPGDEGADDDKIQAAAAALLTLLKVSKP